MSRGDSRRKVVTAVCLLVTLCMMGMPGTGLHSARAAESDGWLYTLRNGEATLTRYMESSVKNVVVPAVIDGYPVKTMKGSGASWPMFGRDVENVTLSEGIEILDLYGLSGDGILSVTLPNSLRAIGQDGVYCPSLKQLNIPAGVEQIYNNSFSGCLALEAITVSPDNNHFCSADGVLYTKNKTELIAYPIKKSRYQLCDS